VATERVIGERFTAVEPTPLLAALIEGARLELAAAVAAVAPQAEVTSGRRWRFDTGTELTPSIVVSRPGGGEAPVPDLVVEFRTESTGRYVLGPKRMAYSRFRVPEFWYVDPLRRRVAVLRSLDGDEYGWPPEEHDADGVLESRHLPGLRVPVRALVGSAFAVTGRGPAPPDDDWLEA
jgi:Uma2 family endonuclease